ncbi:hypothetical protein PsorP6_000791 [Peronosclerospora sorghi]|uniref:Uncharacterized protein n=1 Tax=Peronosclerospora sorghi TaxID=230839 RepID=A0ACC0WT17_9STRA|nr:hypothetical protein PsorP6_000791 [Peronosclerospora sorghi]
MTGLGLDVELCSIDNDCQCLEATKDRRDYVEEGDVTPTFFIQKLVESFHDGHFLGRFEMRHQLLHRVVAAKCLDGTWTHWYVRKQHLGLHSMPQGGDDVRTLLCTLVSYRTSFKLRHVWGHGAILGPGRPVSPHREKGYSVHKTQGQRLHPVQCFLDRGEGSKAIHYHRFRAKSI